MLGPAQLALELRGEREQGGLLAVATNELHTDRGRRRSCRPARRWTAARSGSTRARTDRPAPDPGRCGPRRAPPHCPARTGGTALTGVSSTSWRSKKGRIRSVSSSRSAQSSTGPGIALPMRAKPLVRRWSRSGRSWRSSRVLGDAGEISGSRRTHKRIGRVALLDLVAQATGADQPFHYAALHVGVHARGQDGLCRDGHAQALGAGGRTSRAGPRPRETALISRAASSAARLEAYAHAVPVLAPAG